MLSVRVLSYSFKSQHPRTKNLPKRLPSGRIGSRIKYNYNNNKENEGNSYNDNNNDNNNYNNNNVNSHDNDKVKECFRKVVRKN